MSESDHQEPETNSSNRPAAVVSWIALALAILVAGYLIRDRLDISDIRPGGDTTGLPEIGEPAPNFTAIDAGGNLISLSEFEGQPVWLNFWGSWCPPCRAEIPDMIQAYDVIQDDNIAIIAVSLEEPSKDAFAYAERTGMDFVVLSDPDKEAISGKYRIRTFPTHIFIDRDGIVRDIVLTPMSTQTAINKAESIS